MASLKDYNLLCFDVYGTLIDWETGVLSGLESLTSQLDHKPDKKYILQVYHKHEASQQKATPDLKYSALLTAIYPKIAVELGVTATKANAEAFGNTIGTWPAFPDTVDALKRLRQHYKLVVLSNVDNESFSKSNAGSLGAVKFDRIITAQEVGSYKPDLRNFEYMLKIVRDELSVEKDQVLATAQSQFHDHHPAKKMGLKSVWIERRGTMGNQTEEIYDWKFATLGEMADALEKESA